LYFQKGIDVKRVFLGSLLLMLVSYASSAIAVQWTMCDTCTTNAQFEGAALGAVGNSLGEHTVWVGNTVRGEVHEVGLYVLGDGDIRRLEPGDARLDTLVSGVDSQSTQSQISVMWDVRQNAVTETHFRNLVSVVKREVNDLGSPFVLPVDPAFASFLGRDNAALAAIMWSEWGYRAYTTRPQDNLVNEVFVGALTYFTNKLRIEKCVIFNNGDMACFYINKTEFAAPDYINKTAITRGNVPIGPNGGRGGLYGVTPTGENGSLYGPIRYAPTGSFWQFCSWLGNATDGWRLLGCYVTWVP
jgi:hypothetical protein